jgi:hypothetical protein
VNTTDLKQLDSLRDLLKPSSIQQPSALPGLLDEHAKARTTGAPPPTQPVDIIRHCPTVAHVSKDEAELLEPIVNASKQNITLERVTSAF